MRIGNAAYPLQPARGLGLSMDRGWAGYGNTQAGSRVRLTPIAALFRRWRRHCKNLKIKDSTCGGKSRTKCGEARLRAKDQHERGCDHSRFRRRFKDSTVRSKIYLNGRPRQCTRPPGGRFSTPAPRRLSVHRAQVVMLCSPAEGPKDTLPRPRRSC
jgi:hypothetical protein